MLPKLANWKVKLPILEVRFLHRRAPARIVYPLFRLHNNLVHLIHQILLVRLQPPDDICIDGTRMQRDKGDGRVAAGKLGGVLHVGELALAVAGPLRARAEVLGRLEAVELHAAWERVEEAEGGEEEDASLAGWTVCCLLEGREEKLEEEGVGDVVDAELVFVALLGQGGLGGHDASVTDEDIELGALGEEVLGGCLDRGKGELVALDEGELYGCSRHFGLADDLLGALGAAAGEVDVLR